MVTVSHIRVQFVQFIIRPCTVRSCNNKVVYGILHATIQCHDAQIWHWNKTGAQYLTLTGQLQCSAIIIWSIFNQNLWRQSIGCLLWVQPLVKFCPVLAVLCTIQWFIIPRYNATRLYMVTIIFEYLGNESVKCCPLYHVFMANIPITPTVWSGCTKWLSGLLTFLLMHLSDFLPVCLKATEWFWPSAEDNDMWQSCIDKGHIIR